MARFKCNAGILPAREFDRINRIDKITKAAENTELIQVSVGFLRSFDTVAQA